MIALIVALILVGLVLWAISQLPIDPAMMNLIRVIVIVCAVFYVLQAFHLLGSVRLP